MKEYKEFQLSDLTGVIRGDQGTVVGFYCLSFYEYINDIDCGMASDISTFIDDTKAGRLIRLDNDTLVLQEELNCLHE